MQHTTPSQCNPVGARTCAIPGSEHEFHRVSYKWHGLSAFPVYRDRTADDNHPDARSVFVTPSTPRPVTAASERVGGGADPTTMQLVTPTEVVDRPVQKCDGATEGGKKHRKRRNRRNRGQRQKTESGEPLQQAGHDGDGGGGGGGGCNDAATAE